jgi:hypothetical protein
LQSIPGTCRTDCYRNDKRFIRKNRKASKIENRYWIVKEAGLPEMIITENRRFDYNPETGGLKALGKPKGLPEQKAELNRIFKALL